jgi:hypothetical protein
LFALRGYAAFALGELDNNNTDEARSVIANLMKQFHPDQT